MKTLAQYLAETETTQESFAERMHVKQSTVSRWSKGLASPDIATALEIEGVTDGAVTVQSWRRSAPTPKHTTPSVDAGECAA